MHNRIVKELETLTKCNSNVDQSYPPYIQILLKEDIEHRVRKDIHLQKINTVNLTDIHIHLRK